MDENVKEHKHLTPTTNTSTSSCGGGGGGGGRPIGSYKNGNAVRNDDKKDNKWNNNNHVYVDNNNNTFRLVKTTHINKYYGLLNKDFSDESIIGLVETLIFERNLKWSYVQKILISLIEHGKRIGDLENDYIIKTAKIKKHVFLKIKYNESKLKLMEKQTPYNFSFNDDQVREMISLLKHIMFDPLKWSELLYKRNRLEKVNNIEQFTVFLYLILCTGMRGVDVYQLTALEMLFMLYPYLNESRTSSIKYINKNGTLHLIRVPKYIRYNVYIKNYFLKIVNKHNISVPLDPLSSEEERTFNKISLFTVSRIQLNYLLDKFLMTVFKRTRDTGCRWHAFRRWFVKNICNNVDGSNSLTVASKLVGHSNTRTTTLYKNNAFCNAELQIVLDKSLSMMYI